MEKDLITWTDLQECELSCLMFGGCKFIKDFGPFKNGESAECLSFNIEEGTLESYDHQGNTIKSCKITFAAVE